MKELLRRLPRRRRWKVQATPLDFDFSPGLRGPAPLDRDAYDFPLEAAWLQLAIFGEYDYAEGGGAHVLLGVRERDGRVYGLDFERDEKPMFLLNSGLEAFIETFECLDAHLRKGRALPSDIEKHLRAIDPKAYPSSDWKPFVKFAT
jgi:hypothetical protein